MFYPRPWGQGSYLKINETNKSGTSGDKDGSGSSLGFGGMFYPRPWGPGSYLSGEKSKGENSLGILGAFLSKLTGKSISGFASSTWCTKHSDCDDATQRCDFCNTWKCRPKLDDGEPCCTTYDHGKCDYLPEPGNPYSKSCKNGYCDPNTCTCGGIPADSCTDTDGGKVYDVRGTVKTVSNKGNVKGSDTDFCLNEGRYLQEHYCIDTKEYIETYFCPNGCKDGACIEKCASDDDCGYGYECDSGECKKKLLIGPEVEQISCIKAGQVCRNPSLGPAGIFGECCKGLVEINDKTYYDENCKFSGIIGTGIICSDCGNGICEEWESKCNCPVDCEGEENGKCVTTEGLWAYKEDYIVIPNTVLKVTDIQVDLTDSSDTDYILFSMPPGSRYGEGLKVTLNENTGKGTKNIYGETYYVMATFKTVGLTWGTGASYSDVGIKQSKFTCEGHCKENKCVEVGTVCSDTDGGINPYLKGILSYPGFTGNDYCVFAPTGSNLIPTGEVLEFFCTKKDELGNQHNSKKIICPNGCEDGACKDHCTSDTECLDGYICRGYKCTEGCRGNGQCAPDKICENYKCVEKSCSSNTDCPDHYTCKNGKCYTYIKCTEDDGGYNIFKKGTTKGFNVWGTYVEKTDYCGTSAYVNTEYYCKDGTVTSKRTIYCPEGYKCEGGACIKDICTKDTDCEKGKVCVIYPSTKTTGVCQTPGTERGWEACRGDGLHVCVEKVKEKLGNNWQSYFEEHTSCIKNYNCQGEYYNCNKACPEPIESSEEPTCTDTDGGFKPDHKGTVTSKINGVSTDICREGYELGYGFYNLIEYYCKDNGRKRGKAYFCPYGCSNGECNTKEEDPCTDTDGGINLLVKGKATDPGKYYEDCCIPRLFIGKPSCQTEGKKVLEAYCYGGKAVYTYEKCEGWGNKCIDGICKK